MDTSRVTRELRDLENKVSALENQNQLRFRIMLGTGATPFFLAGMLHGLGDDPTACIAAGAGVSVGNSVDMQGFQKTGRKALTSAVVDGVAYAAGFGIGYTIKYYEALGRF